MAGDEGGKGAQGGTPAEAGPAPDRTLLQQVEELRRQLAGAPADDALRRRLEVVAAIGVAYEEQLRLARRSLRQLEDLFLPVCMFCKRVRTDESYWERIERFFSRNADITFSHGICPSCFDERFGVAGAPPATPPQPRRVAPPATLPQPELGDEESVGELRALLADPALRASPQHAALQRAVDRCARSLARYRKAVEISDGYQDEFRQRLERAVRSDGLTGFASRAAAVEAIEDAFERARAGALRAPALVIVEVRDLRTVNRRHGYATGDRALVALSRALRTSASTALLRARWSGTAFALLVDAAQAPKLVEAVLASLRAVVVRAGEVELTLSVEAGLAFADGAPDAAAWVAAAEEAVARG